MDLSLVVNTWHMRDYFMDSVSIRSFHAFHKGNFVSASAGNGHFLSSVANVAPLTMTVAASYMDGLLHSFIYLGNSKIIKVIFNICSLKKKLKVNLLINKKLNFPGNTYKPSNRVYKIHKAIQIRVIYA